MQLLTGDAIATAVHDVLNNAADERIVAVAFVGRNPLRWIAAPKGLQLYCWPRPGATHPDGIRALLQAGVQVYFVPHLHAKVYWSRQNGAVLGSANLSHSALGDDGLHEAAVRLAAGELDIDELLDQFREQAISCVDRTRFETALAELDVEHVAYLQRNSQAEKVLRNRELSTFGQWVESPFRKRWQMDYWTYAVDENPVDPADESAIWPYENSANKSTPDALRLAVPTLEIQLNRAGTKVAKDSEPLWWYPKKTYVTNTEAYKDIPHTWVCRKCVPEREVVPFDPEEPAFKRALTYALAVAGDQMDNIEGCVNPAFLQALVQGYRP
jgi:hypothetical protein